MSSHSVTSISICILIRTILLPVLADVDTASANGSTSGIDLSLLIAADHAGMDASRIRQALQPPARCVSLMFADGGASR